MVTGTSQLNLYTENRWIAIIPRPNGVGDDSLPINVAFNIATVKMGDRVLSSSKYSAMGYSIDYPTNVITDDKALTFTYLVDSAFKQYAFLYDWFSKMAVDDGSGLSTEVGPGGVQELMVDVRLIPLSEFKGGTPIEFIYRNCWISKLSGLDLKYNGNADHVKNDFTLRYQNVEIVKNNGA